MIKDPCYEIAGGCPACKNLYGSVLEFRDTIACRNCGLGFYQDPKALAAALRAEGYPKAESMAPEAPGERQHKISVLHKVLIGVNAFKGLGDRIDGFFGRCFEIGFGNGYMMESAKMCRWQVDGCDASSKAVESAHGRMLNAFTARFDALDQEDGIIQSKSEPPYQQVCVPLNNYDLVWAWDAMEHMEDLPKAFTNVAAILKPGGFFVMSSPRFQRYFDKPDHPHFQDRSHLWHMGLDAIPPLANRAGLAVLKMEEGAVWNDTGWAHKDNVVAWMRKGNS